MAAFIKIKRRPDGPDTISRDGLAVPGRAAMEAGGYRPLMYASDLSSCSWVKGQQPWGVETVKRPDGSASATFRLPWRMGFLTIGPVAQRPLKTPRQRGRVHIIIKGTPPNSYHAVSLDLLKLVLVDVPTTPAEARRRPVLWMRAFHGIDDYGHTIAEVGGARVVFCGQPPKTAKVINVNTLLRDTIRAASS